MREAHNSRSGPDQRLTPLQRRAPLAPGDASLFERPDRLAVELANRPGTTIDARFGASGHLRVSVELRSGNAW